MYKTINKGFTLIELLVVIAIIGILASIVLVSLGNARQKGADAGIMGNMDSVRTQAEVFSGNNSNSYGVQANVSDCSTASAGVFNDATVKQAMTNAEAQASTATINAIAGKKSACGSTATSWWAAVVLKTDATNTWCVDSAGKAKQMAVSAIDTAGEVTAMTACI